MSRSFSSSSSTKRSFNNASRMNQSSLAVDNSEKFKKTGIGSNLSLNTGNLSIGDDDPGDAKLLVKGDSNIMGKLGIGTKSPSTELHVVGDINYTGDIYKNGVLIDAPWEKNSTTNNIYYNTGNVGIGTERPSKTLEVIGDISFSGNLYQGNSLFTSGGGSSLTIQNEGVSLDTSATTLNFTGVGVTASGTGATKTINITGTTIDKDTDVSLNNLYVHGDVSLNVGSIFSNDDISTNGDLYVGENIIAYNNVDIKNNLDICGNVDVYGNLTIHNSNLNYVNINSTNISVSDNIIDIGYSDVSNTYDKGLIFNSIKDNSNQALLWKYDQSSFVLANVGDISGLSPPYNVSSINNYSNLRLGKVIGEEDASFNKNVIIDGSMGISTTNPLEKLHVVGDLFVDGNNIWLKGRENDNENLRLYHSNSNAYIDWSGGNFYIRNNNSTKVLIKDNGNIGIGTTNPTAKLEIMGDISNSNNAYINGNIYSEGDLSLNSGNLFVSGDISSNSKIKSASLDSSNVNISDLTVFDNLILGSTNVSDKFTQIDTSINLLDTSASNLTLKVNILDGSVNFLNAFGASLVTRIDGLDISLIPLIYDTNVLTTRVNILDYSSNLLTTRANILDYSVNLLDINLSNLTSRVNTSDTSMNLLDTSASNLTTRVNILDASFILLDNSAINLTTSVNTLDASVNLLDTSASNLTSRVNILDTSFVLLDNSASNLTTNVNILDTSVNLLDTSASNLTARVNILDTSVNLLDTSASNLTLSKQDLITKDTDLSVNNLYITNDLSLNSGNIFVQGNIGIGTSNPTSELDVNGDISCNGILTVPDISCNDNLFVGNKVGIGTQIPSKTLEVIGDISFSGNLYQGSSLFTSGGGGSSLTIQDEGSSLSTAATTLNFVGSGVTASGTGATKTITINSSGGGGGSTSIDKDTDVSLNNLYVHGDVSLNAGSIFSNGDISTNSDLLFSGNLVKNGSNIVLDEVTLDSLDFTDTNLVNSSGTNVEVELAGSVSDFTINSNLYVPTGDISINTGDLYIRDGNISISGGIIQGYSNGEDVSAGFWIRPQLNIGSDGVLKISSEVTTGGYGREGVSLQTYIDNNHDNGPNAGFSNVANRHTLALQPLHGNVGIGTLEPKRKLEIIGDISFSGTLYNGGEEFSSGGGTRVSFGRWYIRGYNSTSLTGTAYNTAADETHNINGGDGNGNSPRETTLTWTQGNSGLISSSASAPVNTNILTHNANSSTWTAVAAGTYIINSIIHMTDGNSNERAMYYTFCRVTKSGINYYGNTRDYQLGASYYRDDNGAYDEFVCNGCINVYLDAGSTFEIIIATVFNQDNNSNENKIPRSENDIMYTEIEYIG